MGLDITAYGQLEFIEKVDSYQAYEDKYDWRDESICRAGHWNPDFADRAAPIIEEGIYRVNGDTFGFKAGSYSGYNEWREWLAMQAHGVSPEVIWNDLKKYRGTRFFELIHFSDSEGIIGSVVAAKLKADFEAFTPTGGTYELASYMRWMKAFRIAADNGMVIFH